MNAKSLVWLGFFIGSTAGAYLPTFFGAGILSFSSVIFSAVGGIAGIWLGYKLSRL